MKDLKDLDGAGIRAVVDRVKGTVEEVGAKLAGGELPARGDPPIGEALRLIRTRMGLTQKAAGRRPGAPDDRSISHWETGKKEPSLKMLFRYLVSLGLDLYDLQEAIDHLEGRTSRELTNSMVKFERRLVKVERELAERLGGQEALRRQAVGEAER